MAAAGKMTNKQQQRASENRVIRDLRDQNICTKTAVES
jgi:hypothetical protein